MSFGESVNQLLITDRVEYIPVVMFSLRGCLYGQNCLKLGDISADKISRGNGLTLIWQELLTAFGRNFEGVMVEELKKCSPQGS